MLPGFHAVLLSFCTSAGVVPVTLAQSGGSQTDSLQTESTAEMGTSEVLLNEETIYHDPLATPGESLGTYLPDMTGQMWGRAVLSPLQPSPSRGHLRALPP